MSRWLQWSRRWINGLKRWKTLESQTDDDNLERQACPVE